MKRLLALLLMLTLLTGCVVNQPTEPSVETDPPTTAPTEPPAPSLYAPGSQVEQQTGGAVRVYPLDGYCDGMVLLQDRVVLYYLDEQMQLKVYTGDNLTMGAVTSHHISFPTDGKGLQVMGQGIFYYDPGTNTVVLLNSQLQEKYRMELQHEIQGIPVINAAMDTVYYCTNQGIRALNLDAGIAHMLRYEENDSTILQGQIFDGELLICQDTETDGSVVTEFISTETGLLVDKDRIIHWAESTGSSYLLEWQDEQGVKYLFGTRDGETFEFLGADSGKIVAAALELGCVLTVTQEETGCTLDLYHLESGLRTASVTVEGLQAPRNLVTDSRGFVWFMDDNSLYRWDVTKSTVADEAIYTNPWYTGSDPNEAGLQQCKTDAQTLGEKYGMEIRIWQDAVQGPWDKMTPEYRVELFRDALEEMEALFSQFPEGMLKEIGSICDSKKISISIVADTGLEQGQVTWVNGNAHIALETGENFRVELLRTLYRVMDTYVLGQTSVLDEWKAEKPAEDRAQFFMEAMTEDNGDFFSKNSAQSKLRTLCNAIRRAFGMRKLQEELPWEQYLKKPMY